VTDSTQRTDLAWLLDSLVRVPQVLFALVMATDGLLIQKSTNLPRDVADPISAGAGSLYGVAAGMGKLYKSGRVQHAIIEYSDRTLFVVEAGQNARLAVVCEQPVDMGMVAYEMGRLVTRIGEVLGTDARPTALAPNGQAGAAP
jgi:predicted regulator of Ras-like GTPase activity (Roadblock/LC7/MglB family)